MPAPVSIILVVCPCVIIDLGVTWNWVTWIFGGFWGDMEGGGSWGDMERWWVLV